MPIRLLSPYSQSLVASYPLIHEPTERYLAPHSMVISSTNPNKFLAGADSLIAEFDLSRPSSSPVTLLPTIPSKRKTLVGGGVGMKGIVSALAVSSNGVLAAGTFTGWLGFYDGEGIGDTLAVFPLRVAGGSMEGPGGGEGVTSLAWSSCGRYLVVAERGSDGTGVWDIRGTGKRLAWLSGRKAETMQRLNIAIAAPSTTDTVGERGAKAGLDEPGEDGPSEHTPHSEAESVWAGGTDGRVRMWAGLGQQEGVLAPTWSFAAHDEAVSAVDMHPYAAVMATCSGAREWDLSAPGSVESRKESHKSDEESEGDSENEATADGECMRPKSQDRSLRIWSFERNRRT